MTINSLNTNDFDNLEKENAKEICRNAKRHAEYEEKNAEYAEKNTQ
jgi:hypothetical protein